MLARRVSVLLFAAFLIVIATNQSFGAEVLSDTPVSITGKLSPGKNGYIARRVPWAARPWARFLRFSSRLFLGRLKTCARGPMLCDPKKIKGDLDPCYPITYSREVGYARRVR
jgi:hypothetical protein